MIDLLSKEKMSVTQDMAVVQKLFEQTKNKPDYDWKNSSFAGLKEKPFLDTKVILEIIKKLRNKYYAKNGLKSDSLTLGIAYWYDRLLAQKNVSIHDESDVKILKESLKFLEQVTLLDDGKTGKVFGSIADIYMTLER